MTTDKCRGLRFAVAVRDGSVLRLFATVCRQPAGDIYANFQQEYLPDADVHSSYHASGQRHDRSFRLPHHIRFNQPPPNTTFTGPQNLTMTGITIDDVRSIDRTCDPCAFTKVFEIPASNLRPDLPPPIRGFGTGSTLSFDLVEPGQPGIINAGSRIIQEAIFDDTIPWIRITLFDPRPAGSTPTTPDS